MLTVLVYTSCGVRSRVLVWTSHVLYPPPPPPPPACTSCGASATRCPLWTAECVVPPWLAPPVVQVLLNVIFWTSPLLYRPGVHLLLYKCH
eukprot:jgi/Botrbrau1/14308/Bobra.0287s0001.1